MIIVWLKFIACMLLILPARYGLEGHYGQVYSSELAGVRFFSERAGPVEPWLFYRMGDKGVFGFYNADMLVWPTRGSGGREFNPGDLNGASYVLGGKQGASDEAWISEWLRTGGADDAALVYSNGYFRIYRNR